MVHELLLAAGGLAVAGVSARWNWWRWPAPGLPILMYHKVGDPPAGSRLRKLWVSVDKFHWQMSYLKRRGFLSLTLAAVADHLRTGKPIPANGVVITFDDGYQNNGVNAFPILQSLGLTATIFVVVQAVGQDNFWHDPANEIRLPMLTWEELKRVQAAGWEIGSHTLTHPRLTRLSPEDARREIKESRQILQDRLGRAPVSFAFPYGDGADRPDLQRAIQEAGYHTASSVHRGKADVERSPFCLNRIFVRGEDTRWDFSLQLTRGQSRF